MKFHWRWSLIAFGVFIGWIILVIIASVLDWR